MEVFINSFKNNEKFFTIKEVLGINNRQQLYRRTNIIYGKFIDAETFEYNVVYNNRIQYDGFPRHCTWKDLLKHDNNKIYKFSTLDEAKMVNDVIRNENRRVPMIYHDRAAELERINKLKNN